MSVPRTMRVDWRGHPDLSVPADFYSIGPYFDSPPRIIKPEGRVLVAISSTVYLAPSGAPVDRPYNADLYRMALKYGALSHLLDPDPNGYRAQLFDITKRGVIREWLAILDRCFVGFAGFHADWFTAWSWAFSDMAPLDAQWDSALGAFAEALRSRGKLVLGQQYHLTTPLMNTNGAFCEQYPTFNRYTIEQHTADLGRFRDMTKRVDGDKPREVVWTQEVRDPSRFPAAYIQQIKDWAAANDVVLSFGRDATAGVGL